ncbi:uncharacterized protein A1O9_10843 [Exophiala aquamarina CBS 119918]|uniref:NAD-dependent epimerase/dehydratase domain-containing protein n=1 Tax=Exophiala aquamarina CBS 119918 TaxID=1182545 RepID=A0A072NZT9_9EURO|nr:uncharacterized protein A1O9_10843 [Exophiala aquamarina CBS 119918]KEF52937.1 hypothetical protein A1O9_10843 [Exophiala aquamarina CBS 119918]
MAAKILLTGATGYVGGVVLHFLASHLTDCSITCLVRTEEQSSLLKSTYLGVRTVLGTLESQDLLIAEAAKVDIVVHAANVDHKAGTLNLLYGLKSRRAEGKEPLYLLVSGTASLLDKENVRAGLPMTKAYNDVLDASDIWNLPLDRPHVAIERRFVQEGEASGIKTIIVSPSQIFHTGIGIGKTESYLNEHPRAIIKRGAPFVVNGGRNLWCWISIEDLADAICFLLRRYLDEETGSKDFSTGYGRDGYYYVQTGELSAYEQTNEIAEELLKLGAIRSTKIDHITEHDATQLNDYGVLLWGSSMRSIGQKLRDLGWTPKTTDWKGLVRRAARVEWEAVQAGESRGSNYQRV